MPFTFDQSKDEIARLVKHFSANQAAFLAPGYKEAHARQEFIDPLFIALNWDVHNQGQSAPDYREVIVEDSIEMEGHEARKAPDYVFRIGRERKFFAEAKKPGVDLKTAAGPAYQLRRYAWSAKLSLSVLTDFQEWAAYDCRIRPSEKDKSTVARLGYMTYAEYADRWREIWDVYSRESVWGGSFDRYAQGGKGKRGATEVDAEFLKEIEGWRDTLARNIALRNPELTLEEMNDAVQRTIDRIIFLRMGEARGMEEYGQLQRIGESENIYANLLVLSIKADAKYNSGLFDFSKKGDQVTPRLAVDDKTLKPILADLYYPQSPYEFSVLPVEILGNVYEQFLGKVIHLTDAHHAKVEEKPEVKKAGGVYYTPSYIVEYIVKNTVGKQIEGKSPAQLKGFRVLDPACGSGSFLLGAYSFLLEYYRGWYSAHEPLKHKEAVAQQADGSWQLTLQERKRILTEHLFGVDIDRQAVEVTKLSLLLKVLEGIKQLTLFNERALPNLDNNIKCGNSLIGPDYFAGRMMPDADELRRVNPFDWKQEFPEPMKAGGFNIVIGNPPYIDSEWLTRTNPNLRTYCNEHFVSAKGNWDIFCIFIEKALDLCQDGGLSSMIVPNKVLSAEYARALRELLADRHTLLALRDYSQVAVFPVSVYPIVYVALAKQNPVSVSLTIEKMVEIKGSIRVSTVKNIQWSVLQKTKGKGWSNALSVSLGDFTNRLVQNSRPLSEVAIVVGAATVSEAYEYKEFLIELPAHLKNYIPLVNTGTIDRYGILWGFQPTRYIKASYKKPVVPKEMWNKLPLKRLKQAQSEKIIIGGMTKVLECAYDTGEFLAGKSTTIVLESTLNLKYLLGILNSKLLTNYYRTVFAGLSLQGGFLRIGPPQIRELPIHIPNQVDKERHEKMVTLVEHMLDLHKRKVEAKDAGEQERLQRVIESTDQQIDALVYELYGLTPEEIAIVEGAA
jgi:hypothetical protein